MADNYDKAAYGGQNPRPSKSFGSRRGKYGRSEGGGKNLYGQRYSTGGGFGLQQGGGFPAVPMGGFGGGGRRGSEFAEEDLKRQLEYDKAIWERSTPDVTGVGGQVRWDRDKNMVTSSLSPENQAIYDAMIKRQGVFGEQADALAGGGWQDAYQQQFDNMRGMYSASDAREEAIRRERQNATGASSTGRFQENVDAAAIRNERDLAMQNQAFLQSQQLIDSGLNRQYGAIGMMADLGDIANRMKVMPVPNTAGNMNNVSSASTAWADLQALEAGKKSKGRSDAWGSILGSLFS
jgi:hypothetical protein